MTIATWIGLGVVVALAAFLMFGHKFRRTNRHEQQQYTPEEWARINETLETEAQNYDYYARPDFVKEMRQRHQPRGDRNHRGRPTNGAVVVEQDSRSVVTRQAAIEHLMQGKPVLISGTLQEVMCKLSGKGNESFAGTMLARKESEVGSVKKYTLL